MGGAGCRCRPDHHSLRNPEAPPQLWIHPTVSIRIDPEDIQRARSLAAKKGLRYQTYLKMLLHEALEHEERRVS
jgi:hypothetical protein